MTTRKSNTRPNPVLALPKNTQGRDFVVGDIHGAFDLLDKALLAVQFDPAKDRLISVGDLVDRGTRSPDCLHYLAQPWFYAVRGNHEDIFMLFFQNGKLDRDSVNDNLQNGMGWLLEQDTDALTKMRRAFEKMPLIIEVETPEGLVGFVHGSVPAGMNWDDFKKNIAAFDPETMEAALWDRSRINMQDTSGVSGVLRLFSGHTPLKGGPEELGNCFFLDTGAVFSLIKKYSNQEFYLTLADIRANADDITHPVPTKDKNVRIAMLKKPSGPKGA